MWLFLPSQILPWVASGYLCNLLQWTPREPVRPCTYLSKELFSSLHTAAGCVLCLLSQGPPACVLDLSVL